MSGQTGALARESARIRVISGHDPGSTRQDGRWTGLPGGGCGPVAAHRGEWGRLRRGRL